VYQRDDDLLAAVGWVFAGPHIPVDKNAPLKEFEAIAAQVPVFRVLPAG
jgi:hypothetical protein